MMARMTVRLRLSAKRAVDLALARRDRDARLAQVGGDRLDIADGLRVEAEQRIGLRRWSVAVAGPAEGRNGEAVAVILHRLLQRQADEGGEAVVPVRRDHAEHGQGQRHRLDPAATAALDARQHLIAWLQTELLGGAPADADPVHAFGERRRPRRQPGRRAPSAARTRAPAPSPFHPSAAGPPARRWRACSA